MANIKQIKLGETNYELLAKYIQDTNGNQKDWSDIVALATAAKLELKVVDSLPTASADTMNAIYLVSEGAVSGTYAEYVTLRSGSEGSYTYAWEKIGTTQADLSAYAKKGTYTSASAGAHTHTVSGSVTIPEVTPTDAHLAVSITDVAVAGDGTADALTDLELSKVEFLKKDATFDVDGGEATKTNVKATASGTAVVADGTANAITGFGTHTTDSVLGADSTFNVAGGDAVTTNIKATASGTAVGADGTAAAITGFGEHSTTPVITALGTISSADALSKDATFNVTGGDAITTNISATASGTAVGADGTAAAITALGTPTTGDALGIAATFTTTVTPTTTNIKATASGTAVGADGTDTFVKSYPGVSSNLKTTSIVPTNGTVTASKVSVTDGSAASWSASVSDAGVLSFSWTSNTPTAVTANDVTAAKLGSAVTVATGSIADDGEGGAVLTGLGTASTASALTGVKVTAQPTVALATGATAGSGVISVATGVNAIDVSATGSISAITSIGTAQTDTAIKALGTPTTADVLTGVKVTAEPTIALATGATAGAGVISVATDVSAISVSATGSAEAVTGYTPTTEKVLTGVKVATQPTVSLNGAAASGVGYVSNVAVGTTTASLTNGTAAEAGSHEHSTTI